MSTTLPAPNLGTLIDHEHDGVPVCPDCVSATGDNLDEYVEIASPSAPCWSCVQMATENLTGLTEF